MKLVNSKGKEVGKYEIVKQSREIKGSIKYKLDGSMELYDSNGKKLETFREVKK